MKSAIRDDNPVIVMKHKFILGMKGQVPEEDFTIPIGKAFIKREGKDVTLIAISHMVNLALKAADQLERDDNISVEVIDPLTLSPLDKETICTSIKKTGRLVTVHENWIPCGMGAEFGAIAYEDCFDYLETPLVRIGATFNPMPYSPGMEDFSIPSVEKIKNGVRKAMTG
jgi:acetoin:2,6-dichlorophenolindophenol oxidoreductase subunit beta